jgi:hypothetical protein
MDPSRASRPLLLLGVIVTGVATAVGIVVFLPVVVPFAAALILPAGIGATAFYLWAWRTGAAG